MKLLSKQSKENKKTKGVYGYDLSPNTYKPVSSLSLEQDSLLLSDETGVTKIELIKSPDGNSDALVFTCKTINANETKLKMLETVRDKVQFETDAKIISSYEFLRIKKDIRKINLFDFLEDIKEKFKSDIRYAYKKFSTTATQNSRHSVYIYHIYALIIATVSLINEMDFAPPVYIEFKTKSKSLVLSFKSKSKRFAGIKNKRKLLNIQGTEMRLEYIGALCREDDISNTLQITDNTLNIEYAFAPTEKEGALYADVLEDKIFFKEYMDIFNPIMHTEVEAKEEE